MHPDLTTDDRSRMCVILVDSGKTLDQTLRADLDRRSWQVSTRHDAVTAMTELCLRLRTGHDPEHPTAIAPALVVVDPDAWSAWPAMRRALARYMPQVPVMEQRNGTIADVHVPANGTPPSSATSRPTPPDRNAGPAGPAGISRDELDMLLQGGS